VRIYLDTNVLVSAVATRGLSADVLQVVLAEHQLVLGEVVLGELRRVLRQKLKLPVAAVDELDAFLRFHGAAIDSVVPLDVDIRDPSDLRILGEALAGKADLLVTGDRDLLDLTKRPLRILAPRGFWDLLRADPR
jgi:putative PIN family toxin of toxin-antitoxin system